MITDRANTNYIPPYFKFHKPEWLDFDIDNIGGQKVGKDFYTKDQMSVQETDEQLRESLFKPSSDEGVITLSDKQIENAKNGSVEPMGQKPEIGKNVMDNISGIMDFGISSFGAVKGTSTQAENFANIGTLASKGLTTGMAIGGPIGAAVGAVAGGVIGTVDYFNDRKSRAEKKITAVNDEFAHFKNAENNMLKIQSGEKITNAMNEQLKKQQQFLNL